MAENIFWLGLHLIPNLGGVRIRQLVERFGSAEKVWGATQGEIEATQILSAKLAETLVNKRYSIDPDVEYEKVRRCDADILTLADDSYPPLLKPLSDAPAVLYIQGELKAEDTNALAIVGTRKTTKYGRDVTQSLTRSLAEQGITIVSGLAQGIDAIAHRSALGVQGRTIAVMGSGLDKLYPREHVSLAEKIVEHGAILSEFPLGTPPLGKNFPQRNRIMSGISLGVLVIEAPQNSGALITAEAALEQGRDVFAIPHNVFNAMGRGTNGLIQDGAKLVLRVRDILDELDVVYDKQQTSVKTEQIAPENETEAIVFRHLNADPIHVDDVARLSGLAIEIVSSTLTILELKGLAETAGPMQYCRAR